MQVRFRIKILPRQPLVDLRCRGRIDSGFAESLVVRFPRRLARLVQRQYRRSQVICDQVVVAGFFQAGFAIQLRLSDGVGAPQAAFLFVFVLLVGSGLLRMGVESVSPGDPVSLMR